MADHEHPLALVHAACADAELSAELANATAERVTVGRSASMVVRFAGEKRTLFAKRGPALAPEADRLEWLAGRCGAPTVVHFNAAGGPAEHDLLVTSEVAGLPSHLAMAGDPNGVVTAYGAYLAEIHSLSAEGCLFDSGPETLHSAAAARVAAGQIDAEEFGGTYSHLTPGELLDRLDAMRPQAPAEHDLVVLHGDYSMPNVIIDGAAVSGVVDVGGLGVGDRYCDLGIAARSLVRNLGPEALPVFFDAYGLEHPELLRLDYHVVLDEFS